VVACVVTRSTSVIFAEANKIRELDKGLNSGTLVNEFVAYVHQHTCSSKTVTLGSERVGQTAAATCAFLLVSLRRLLILVRCAAANMTATGAGGPCGRAMNDIEGYVLPCRSMSG
jgi:hypothetical protein